jgi:hypothetical protein
VVDSTRLASNKAESLDKIEARFGKEKQALHKRERVPRSAGETPAIQEKKRLS